MGIFSFLTGGGGDASDGARREQDPPDTGSGQAESTSKGLDSAEGGTSSDAGSGGPGWNFGALAEPLAAPPAGAGTAVGSSDPVKTLELKPHIIEAISTVFDPEIPVNIYELGLIYDIIVDGDAKVLVKMTLTSPACPSAQSLPGEVQWKVKAVPGVADAVVEIVWDPPWSQEKMSDVARLQLGLF